MVDVFVDHIGSYRDTASNRAVDAWTTFDAGIAYKASHGWLAGTSIRLSGLNLFDTEPPFVNQFAGFDDANATQAGRSWSFDIVKRW